MTCPPPKRTCRRQASSTVQRKERCARCSPRQVTVEPRPSFPRPFALVRQDDRSEHVAFRSGRGNNKPRRSRSVSVSSSWASGSRRIPPSGPQWWVDWLFGSSTTESLQVMCGSRLTLICLAAPMSGQIRRSQTGRAAVPPPVIFMGTY